MVCGKRSEKVVVGYIEAAMTVLETGNAVMGDMINLKLSQISQMENGMKVKTL